MSNFYSIPQISNGGGGGGNDTSIVTIVDEPILEWDISSFMNFVVRLEGNRTLGNPDGIAEGKTGVIDVWQDGTGTRTLVYDWGFVFPNGAAPVLSTDTFINDQLYYYVSKYYTSEVTISNGFPAVVTTASPHNLISGQRIQLTTTGTLPVGLSPNTTYWVNVTSPTTFNVCVTLLALQIGAYLNTSSDGSGTHTATAINIMVSNNKYITA